MLQDGSERSMAAVADDLGRAQKRRPRQAPQVVAIHLEGLLESEWISLSCFRGFGVRFLSACGFRRVHSGGLLAADGPLSCDATGSESVMKIATKFE